MPMKWEQSSSWAPLFWLHFTRLFPTPPYTPPPGPLPFNSEQCPSSVSWEATWRTITHAIPRVWAGWRRKFNNYWHNITPQDIEKNWAASSFPHEAFHANSSNKYDACVERQVLQAMHISVWKSTDSSSIGPLFGPLLPSAAPCLILRSVYDVATTTTKSDFHAFLMLICYCFLA